MSQSLKLLEFPLRGSQLIEASAGTGKTFTLALLYTRLVLGQDQAESAFHRPLTPREILVVTFTEAAAEELRERIRSRLVEAADYFQQAPETSREPHDPLEQLRASYPQELWSGCAWRLQMAAEGMDEASVSTIHSWCNRMLVEHAFDTRGLFSRELVTDTSELLAEVVRDYWRVHFYPLSPDQAELISEEFSGPDQLQRALQDLLKTGIQGVTYQGQPLDVPQLQPYLEAAHQAEQAQQAARRIQQQLEEQLRQSWLDEWDAIEKHLLELRPHLKAPGHDSKTPESYQALLKAIHAWALGQGPQPKKLKNFASGCFQFYAKSAIQEPRPFKAFTLLADYLQHPSAEKSEEQSTEVPLKTALLAHAAQWVKKAFHQRLQQRAEMGFDDLLTQLEAALNPAVSGSSADNLARVLRNNFPVAMIDEFQDTDPVQYRIFNQIYQLEDNHPETGIILIGDPKQAIYSFRGADIHTYLQAREATQGRHYTLSRNFRSTQGVVEAANTLFNFAEQHPRGAFRFKQEETNPLPYVTVQAAGRDEHLYLDEQPAKPLTFWQFQPHEDEKVLGTGAYLEEAAARAASQITTWLESARQHKSGFGKDGQVTRPLQPADLAILVRRGAEADVIRRELAKRGVASVYLSDRESVFASQEAADLLHWLRAVAQPGDERLVRAALGTNTLALPLSQLAAWQEDELAWEEQMDFFLKLHSLWRYQGVLAMLRRLMDEYQLPARLLQEEQGERSLTNLLHLAEWLQEAAAQLDGEQALIRHLAEHLNSPDDQQLLRLESDAQLVQVITIHKSKGLEYPLVLLPFISGWRELDGRTKQLPWRRPEGRFYEVSDNKTFPEAWEAAKDERLSEDMRLLYVAITRARHALWLGVAPLKSGNSKKPQLERSALGYLLGGGAVFDSPASLEAKLQELAALSPTLSLEAAPAITGQRLSQAASPELEPALSAEHLKPRKPWWIASYSAIEYTGLARTTSVTEDSEPQTPAEATAQETSDEIRERQIRPQEVTAENLMLHFPAGSTYGTFLHSLMEWAAAHHWQDLRGFAAAVADDQGRLEQIQKRCQLRNLDAFAEPLSNWLKGFLQQTWPAGFALQDLSPDDLAVELEFLLASHEVSTRQLDQLVCQYTLEAADRPQAEDSLLNGMLKGFIDLVAVHDGRYYVIDWKSNKLGDQHQDYSLETLQQAILKKRYDLQYVLYLLALHRLLKARLSDYDYDTHLGGAIYVFLRGNQHPSQGLFSDKPPRELIEALDQLFSKESGGPA
ncbi:exodeoxyribonuclease V subunit beta [Marinospirillum sp.]|uniref:exodeoxyribonuclease V subunit beta n=1 Tax=Marinospirillum sp. TaxID=2183934 RepID=UPI0038506E0E